VGEGSEMERGTVSAVKGGNNGGWPREQEEEGRCWEQEGKGELRWLGRGRRWWNRLKRKTKNVWGGSS